MHSGGESGGGASGSGHELVEDSRWEQKKCPHGIWAPKVALLIDHTRSRGSEPITVRRLLGELAVPASSYTKGWAVQDPQVR